MVRDLNIPVMIEGAATVRDDTGLALSSRNAYLTPEQLAVARQLNRVLFTMAGRIAADPNRCQGEIEWGLEELRVAGFDRIDYLDVCDAASLKPLEIADRPARVLAAGFICRTPPIDNVSVLVVFFPINPRSYPPRAHGPASRVTASSPPRPPGP